MGPLGTKQREWLAALARYEPRRAETPGQVRTAWTLMVRGLIDRQGKLTDAGRAALAPPDLSRRKGPPADARKRGFPRLAAE